MHTKSPILPSPGALYGGFATSEGEGHFPTESPMKDWQNPKTDTEQREWVRQMVIKSDHEDEVRQAMQPGGNQMIPILIDTETADWCEKDEQGQLIEGKRTPDKEWTRLVQYNIGRGPVVLDLLTEGGLAGLAVLKCVIESGQLMVAHNWLYDLPRLWRLGIKPTKIFDTMIASQILNAGRWSKAQNHHDLRSVMRRYGRDPYQSDAQASDWSLQPLTEAQLTYAAIDVGDEYFQTYYGLLGDLQAEGAEHIMDLEMRVLPIVAQMALDGLKHDIPEWKLMIRETEDKRTPLEEELLLSLDKARQEHFSEDYMVPRKIKKDGSPVKKLKMPRFRPIANADALRAKQNETMVMSPGGSPISLGQGQVIRETLNKIMGIKAKEGEKLTFNVEDYTNILPKEARSRKQPEVEAFLAKYNEEVGLRTILNSYGASFYDYADAGGYIHGEFSLTYAATGRIQARTPSVLTMPHEFQKRLWTCEENEVLISGDYSNEEGRFLFFLGKQWDMYDKLTTGGLDLHCMTLSFMSGIPYDQLVDKTDVGDKVRPEYAAMRSAAKPATFAPAYGSGPKRMMEILRCDNETASAFLENYWAAYPCVKSMQAQQEASAVNSKYITDLALGRRRYFTLEKDKYGRDSLSGNGRNGAFNYACQSCGGSLLKFALITIDSAIKEQPEAGVTIRLCVHDSILITAKKEYEVQASAFLKEAMEINAPALIPGIKIPVEVKTIRRGGY